MNERGVGAPLAPTVASSGVAVRTMAMAGSTSGDPPAPAARIVRWRAQPQA